MKKISLLVIFVWYGLGRIHPVDAKGVDQDSIALDHVYVRISPEQYKSLGESKILKESGIFYVEWDKKVSAWQAHYLNGNRGYIEVFSEDVLKTASWINEFGIGLVTEKSHTLSKLTQNFPKSEMGKYEEGKFEFAKSPFGDIAFTWKGDGSIWLTEFHHQEISKEDVTRSDWMERIFQKGGVATRPNADELERVVVKLPADEGTFFGDTLSAWGFKKVKNTWTHGAQRIVLQNSESKERSMEISITLKTKLEKIKKENIKGVTIELAPSGDKIILAFPI